MPLWDDFGKKAGETARSFGARAKEIAETTKINGQIAIKKTDAEKLYGEIGKAYFAIHAGRSQDADVLDSLCAKVEELDAEIAVLQQQIDAIRQVRRCPECGEVSPNTSRFCGNCGARFPEEQPQPAPQKAPEPEPAQKTSTEDGVEINWPKAQESDTEPKAEENDSQE